MAKQLTENQLTDIISKSVSNILKEWTNGTMPGLSKNPKVAAAQEHAKTNVVGKVGKNDNSWDHQKQSEGGRDKIDKPDLNELINTMKNSKDEEKVREAGEKFAMIMNKNKEVGDKVFYALADISLKHINDYLQWNSRKIAESKKK